MQQNMSPGYVAKQTHCVLIVLFIKQRSPLIGSSQSCWDCISHMFWLAVFLPPAQFIIFNGFLATPRVVSVWLGGWFHTVLFTLFLKHPVHPSTSSHFYDLCFAPHRASVPSPVFSGQRWIHSVCQLPSWMVSYRNTWSPAEDSGCTVTRTPPSTHQGLWTSQ